MKQGSTQVMSYKNLLLMLSSLSVSASLLSASTYSKRTAEYYEEDFQDESDQINPRFISQNDRNSYSRSSNGQGQREIRAQDYPHRFQIGGNYTRAYINPHGSGTFDGNLGGLQAIYEYRPMDRFYGAAKLAWKEGNTHGSASHRSLIYVDVQERLGYTFAFNEGDWLLSLYSGFGYRYLGQKLTASRGQNLHFRYHEFYVPVGFEVDNAYNSWFTWGIGFTWMPQVYPTVAIVPLKGARWSLTDQLANFYVEFPLDFTVTDNKKFHIILKPFYEHWQDGHSTAKVNGLSLGLPGNDYNFFGADLNFAYFF